MEDSKRKKKQMKNVPEINRMEAKESMKDFLTEVCSEKLINFIEDTDTDAESNLSLLDGAEGSCFDDFFDVGLDSFSKWAASKARHSVP